MQLTLSIGGLEGPMGKWKSLLKHWTNCKVGKAYVLPSHLQVQTNSKFWIEHLEIGRKVKFIFGAQKTTQFRFQFNNTLL